MLRTVQTTVAAAGVPFRFSADLGSRRGRVLVAAAALAIAAAPAPASAGSMKVCADRAAIVERLEAKFSETQRSYGLQGSAGVFEVFASDTGTWTILLTAPSGVACIMAAGEAWTETPAIAAAAGDPA